MLKSWGFLESLDIDRRLFVKSPLTPLYQRGVTPPFVKGRSGEIYGECPDIGRQSIR
jgi:hypothetical protein